MSEEILEGLKDKFSPMDAHDVLTKHGGRDKDWHSLSFEHKSNLIDLAKKSKYNHKSPTGRSRGYSFHLALHKIADKAVNSDGTLKRKDMKESENLEELSKQKMAKYMNKAVYDNKNKKRQKGLDTAVKRMSKESEDYEGENLEEALHPLDAHRILNQHGGRNKSFFSMSSDQHDSLADTAKSMGYRHNKHSGKSYARAFHDHLNRTADAHVTEDGKLKPKSKWNNPPSMHEETENLDELSKKTLGNYVKKAASSKADSVRLLRDKHDSIKDIGRKKFIKRTKGIDSAVNKLTKEEYENLDELSKRTLRSYVGKASQDATIQGYNTGKNIDDMKAAEKYAKKAGKRNKGIGQALYKMSKEEYENENFDELDEEFLLEMDQFSDQHIQKLKKAYSTINKIDPTHPTYKKLSDKLESLPDEHLKKLASAKINFISTLANAKLVKRNLSNMKESISYFSDFILEGNGNDAVDIFENIISEKLLNRLNEKREEICEELFSLDELSKKTLGSYINKAGSDKDAALYSLGRMYTDSSKSGKKENERRNKRIAKREKGINTAVKKLTKESYENLDEMTRTANPLDHHDALQIHLYGDNDHDLYKNSAQHIIKNLQRKHAKGNYDHELATKAWEHHAKRALKKYNQEFPDNKIKGGSSTIKKAAEHFRDGYDEEVRGN